jgi:hypothetical protein
MKLAKPVLHYESAVLFFQNLEISFRHGMDLLDKGVLVADGEFNGGKALFLCDAINKERHRQSIVNHRATVRAAQENLVEVT